MSALHIELTILMDAPLLFTPIPVLLMTEGVVCIEIKNDSQPI